MKLPIQTVCMVFGVTMVHLLVIVAISPRGGGESFDVLPMDDAGGVESSTGNPAPEPMAATEEDARGDHEEVPIDLPARLRPLPDSEPPAIRKPIAESADATALQAPGARAAGRIGPMPQS